MKTRIRETEFGNGIKIYQVQTKFECKDFTNELRFIFYQNPIIAIIFSLALFILFPIMMLFWDNKGDHFNIEDAKKEIDEIHGKTKRKEEQKQKDKLAKKVISKTYLKYP